ncbi:alpha/beta hydrolase-fold protein [Corynebacterium hansenii]|uniref:Alpha/beta hydrolase-fold protein n=1 Tax=Corynebacterium hansenii TaxID=394964 RepID=A0ABV7ZR28_9CORY|nr:alpha/beta hydrolase-fold protein [Corynebacterium hansenii]WJZ01225.1 Diacylglycerol acyltransferase/mycolyltransferase Ag85A precursor [Corynebacterium hansenii]
MRDTAHSPRGLRSRVLAVLTAIPLALTLAGVPAHASPAGSQSQKPASSAPSTSASRSAEPSGSPAGREPSSSQGNDAGAGADALPMQSSLWTPEPRPGEQPAPIRETEQKLPNLPGSVEVEKVQWLTERRVMLHIKSAAMPGEPIKVDLLLPRDWNRDPGRTFPTIWHLDGMRARDDWNGWALETNIERYYADKNVIVAMPVGGESSFYTNWNEPDNGKNYQWESFLVDELVPVLREGWRANEDRAVVGLSMGGTAAFNLAAHHPDLFRFAGSFSGYLDTSSRGMPAAIGQAMREAGGYDATKMWGPVDSPRWKDNDPKENVAKLKGMSLYASAGSGNTGQWDVPSTQFPGLPQNTAGFGLEVIARMTTETFAQRARAAKVPVTVKIRESGTHSWPYWQFEMNQAWPQIADALQLSDEDRGANCIVGGAIAERIKSFDNMGACLSPEYDTANGGRAQDFTNGRAYWHPLTGAQFVWGRIGARYHEAGGPESPLGYPKTSEMTTPDGVGRFVHFEHGSIYWTPELGAHLVMGDFMNMWGNEGWEKGRLGYPTSDRRDVPGGVVQDFEGGQIVKPAAGLPQIVLGAIGAAYKAGNGPEGPLGFAQTGELDIRGGKFQRFEHGSVYWSPESGAHAVPHGDIMDHWGSTGWENGPFGYPTGPQKQIPAGGLEQEFQGGWIRQINGKIEEVRR